MPVHTVAEQMPVCPVFQLQTLLLLLSYMVIAVGLVLFLVDADIACLLAGIAACRSDHNTMLQTHRTFCEARSTCQLFQI
jgi:hypothetical protein